MIFICLIALATGQTCPEFICQEFQTDVCMYWNDTSTVYVNSVGCQSFTQSCTLSKALLAFDISTGSDQYNCEEDSSTTMSTGFMYCGSRNEYQLRLSSGSFGKECSTDSDCALEDGSNTPCKCGLDGRFYCAPNPSSEVFNDYWDRCDKEDGVVKAEFYTYYETLHEFYVELQTAPSCAQGLFQEISLLQGEATGYDYAPLICVFILASLF